MKKQLTLVLTLLLLLCACCLISCKGKTCEAHAFTAWETTREATCIEAGERTRVCTQCGETVIEEVAPLGHDLMHVDAVLHCETDGTMAHDHCDRCNKDFIGGQEIAAEDLVVTHTGHQYYAVMEKAPTCTEAGTMMHLHCDGCGENLYRGVTYTEAELTLPAAHEIYLVEEIPVCCTRDGVAAHRRCVRCGAVFTTEGEATTADALIIPHGHTLVHADGTAATCTAYGIRAHDRCSVCSRWFADGEAVTYADLLLEPTGHTYGPLMSSPGRRPHYHCSACDKDFNEGYVEITDLTLPTGHTFTWHDAVPATCTEDGTVGYYTCSDAACAGIKFDAAYTQLADSVLPASHTFSACLSWDDDAHYHVCTGEDCGHIDGRTLHDVEQKMCYDPEEGRCYTYRICRECAWVSSPDYDLPIGFSADRAFLIDKDAVDTWQMQILYENDGESVSLLELLSEAEQARFRETVERLSAADAVLPATESFTLASPLLTEEVEITFDKYRTTLEYTTVYQKGYLDTFGFYIAGNNNSITWVALRDDQPYLEFIDRGGFDPDYDFSEGNKTYTIKVKYDGVPYDITFTYVNEPTINRINILPGEAIVAGSYPKVALHYTNGDYRRYDTSNYEAIEVVDGTFDPMTPGIYRVTFRTRNGYATYGPVTITVRDPDEITGLGNSHLVMPLGAESISVDVRRIGWSGEYDTIDVSIHAILTDDGFDADTVGTYGAQILIGGKIFPVTIGVYDPEDVPATWIYPNVYNVLWLTGRDGTPTPDLTGLYLWVEYANGASARVPITEDMLSIASDEGGYGYYVTVTYRGAETYFRMIPASERHPSNSSSIYVYMNGSNTYGDIYAEDGKIRAGQMVRLQVNGWNWFVPLTADMLYTEDGLPFDLATARTGRHSVVLVCDGVRNTDCDLYVYTTDAVRETLEPNSYGGSYTIIAAGEAYVLEQLQNIRFEHLRYIVADRYLEELESQYYTFDEVTPGDVSHIDFTKPGKVTIPISLGDLTCDLTICLVPALSLYTGETYLWEGDTLTVYENGYARHEDGTIMTWVAENEALGLFYLTELAQYGETRLVQLDAETHICRGWKAEDLGGDVWELRYSGLNSEMLLRLFTADGVYYGDLYAIYNSSYTSFIGTERVVVSADGTTLVMDGTAYIVDAAAGTLTCKMGGETVYTYETEKGEIYDDMVITFLLNDDGVCYMTAEKTEGADAEIVDSYRWRIDTARGVIVLSQMKYEFDAFEIDADGKLILIV